ncbi:hypothetical protein BH10PLA1_BH10PLA1_08850 [soil metagenome]
MAATVSLFSSAGSTKSTAAAKSNRPPSVDNPNDDFAKELTRASDSQANKPQDTAEAKKPEATDTTAAAKKTQAKGKSSKKDKTSDKPADDVTTDASPDTKIVTKKSKPTDADTDGNSPGDDTATVEEVPTEPKPVAEKDPATAAPVADASALTLVAAVQSQPVAQAKPADAPDAAVAKAATTDQSANAANAAAIAKEIPTDGSAQSPEQAVASNVQADAQPADAVAATDTLPTVAALGEDPAAGDAQPATAAKKTTAAATSAATDTPTDTVAAIAQYLEDLASAADLKPKSDKPVTDTPSVTSIDPGAAAKTLSNVAGAIKPEQVQTPPEARFADANHPEIVKSLQTQLMPHGGTMQLRLDPPELGALQVLLTVKDGVATASFQTSNDDATRLLSHSLTQLKTALESAGVTVDKLQVQQSPRETHTNAGEDQHRGQHGQEDAARQQEQQRKEVIKRMWRKLSGVSDPLDMVA